MDSARANDLLRYGIGVLRGQYVICRAKGRIHIALILLNDLKDMGAWWQARILEYWIHRAQGEDLLIA